MTLSLVNPSMSVPCAYRLYLPKAWSEDRQRRRAAAIPNEIGFQTKPELALAQVDDLLAADLPRLLDEQHRAGGSQYRIAPSKL